MPAEIDLNYCVGCGNCEDGCPAAAIDLSSGCAEVDQERCLECERCIEICEFDAIYMVEE